MPKLSNIFKRVVKNITPPLLFNFIAQADQPSSVKQGALFDGDDKIFKELISGAKIYAEYGCGASTIWVANNTQCQILSTDSSEHWLKNVFDGCKEVSRVRLHYANIGKIGEWGTPLNYEMSHNFSDYTDWIWRQNSCPDVVLVDGRFRVCCFLTSLLNAREGAALVFDDYTNREQYHYVERFVKPTKTFGRQSIFLVPNKDSLQRELILDAIEKFRFVFD